MNVFSVGFPRVYRFLTTSFLRKNKMWEFPHFKSHTTINRTFILNSKPGNMGVPTNYVSLGSFYRFERTFYNKVAYDV
ncbi:hypothetical protein [Leptospira santarosai]|uniref:hypothetical protein n=1 Tax=Leptospira santarosai TaxID=28183 RepID=UPI0031FDE154